MKSPTQRLLLLIVGVLLVPIVPFVLFGAWFEPWIESLLSNSAADVSPGIAFGSVVGVLAIDILLPIPSSAVCAFAGKQLGIAMGTIACWTGLNLSAAIGYWIGSKFGRPVATRFSDESTLLKLKQFDQKSSVMCLIVCRSLPIVAEASVLLMGVKKLSLASFWPPVLLSNLAIAAALCSFGAWSAEANMFLLAICISVALPLLFVIFWKVKR